MQESISWKFDMPVVLFIGAAIFLTLAGSFVSVIYTDTLQALLRMTGALKFRITSMMEIGRLERFRRRSFLASPHVPSTLLTYNLCNTASCTATLRRKL